LDGDSGDLFEEGFADAESAEVGGDEEVFEVKAGLAEPGGVVEEVKGESCGLTVVLGDEAVVVGIGAETVVEELLFGGCDGVWFAFVGGEGADKTEDMGYVGGRGGSDGSGRPGRGMLFISHFHHFRL
jgi:hypothetical protein